MWVRRVSDTTLDPQKFLKVPNALWVAAPGTLLIVVLATLAKFAINLVEPNSLIFATYYPALAIATMMFGRVWGYITLLSSMAVVDYAFMEPYATLMLGSRLGMVNLALFFLCGGLLVEICAAYRTALKRIQTKRELLAQEHARTELLARELQHRTKNTAAVIASIVRQSLRGDTESANRILGRINAMYSADLLDRTPKGLCDLSQVLSQELSVIEPHRISTAGPSVWITYELARSLAMVVHELLTNAAKYGALSTAAGRVDIVWTADGEKVALRWEESGGPLLEGAPARLGFGSFLIERLLGEHGGTIEQTFCARGLVCEMNFTTAAATADAAA